MFSCFSSVVLLENTLSLQTELNLLKLDFLMCFILLSALYLLHLVPYNLSNLIASINQVTQTNNYSKLMLWIRNYLRIWSTYCIGLTE